MTDSPKNPVISFIIPCRNEEEYIGTTLTKLFQLIDQSGVSMEVIVADGGSTDRTIEICKEFDVTIVQSESARRSIAGGRNAGAAQSSGLVLFHMDADVSILNFDKMVEDITQFILQRKCVAATCPILPRKFPNAAFQDRFFHFLINLSIRISLRLGAFLAKGECQIVDRISFIEVGGYREDRVVGEDCNLFYKLNKIGYIKYFTNFSVSHSTRRFDQRGYVYVFLQYAREAFFLLVFRRNYVKVWSPIR
jgi:glycosyltransferase involved in cell wall biosynthesis